MPLPYNKKLNEREGNDTLGFPSQSPSSSKICGTCEDEIIFHLADLYQDGANDMYEAYAANKMSTESHIYLDFGHCQVL